MKILIAPDKFKGSLTASQVCDAVAEGLSKKFPDATITKLPLADGGEGTVDILGARYGRTKKKVKVAGPFFNELEAEYWTDFGLKAFIEMASASGLQLVDKEKRNVLETTTLGTGQLMRHAIEHAGVYLDQQPGLGPFTILLGIGGSATNDAGIGMAEALGYRFLDASGNQLKPIGKNLVNIETIDTSNVMPELKKVHVMALCDVNNPLYGPNGAAHVYGSQKGATPEGIELLDRGLMNFDRVAKKTFGKSADFAGAGAGGGIAGGASVFLDLEVRQGTPFLMLTQGVDEKIQDADLIITGEGKIDRQTLAGKVVASVGRKAAFFNKKVIAVCGVCELRKSELKKIGITDVISLTDPFTTPEEAIANAYQLLSIKTLNFDPHF